MANTPVIVKDLGLVTAYGYALAGGYQGTEAQFIQDFAALMSGQYTALANKPSINGVTLTGNKTSADLGLSAITNYGDLSGQPSINNVTLTGNKTAADLSLQEQLTAGQNITIQNGVISAIGGGSAPTVDNADVTGAFESYIETDGSYLSTFSVYMSRYGRITLLYVNGTLAEGASGVSLSNRRILRIKDDLDGALEEGNPFVPAWRLTFTRCIYQHILTQDIEVISPEPCLRINNGYLVLSFNATLHANANDSFTGSVLFMNNYSGD